MNLAEEIKSIVTPDIASESVRKRFLDRLEDGDFTRDENPKTHYCVYFLPYDKKSKRVFIVHHKKAKQWLSPGGHIDRGESSLETLNREIHEELGIKNGVREEIKPFHLSIVLISNPLQSCKEHLDIWYGFPTDGNDFNVDPKEFNETRWTTIYEARNLVIDRTNLEALDKIEKLFV